MIKDKCTICDDETKNSPCERCSHLIKKGATKETIRRMLSDVTTNKIWLENKEKADRLARAYYDSLLEEYNVKMMREDNKENFGFNTFADGINLGLDIVLPLLDEEHAAKVKEKIETMIKRREEKKL